MTVNFQQRQTTSTPATPVTLTINCANGCPLQTDVSYFGRMARGSGKDVVLPSTNFCINAMITWQCQNPTSSVVVPMRWVCYD